MKAAAAPRSSASRATSIRRRASVADELSRQYYLGYSSHGRKDGQWHTIRVELRDGRHLVRARKGYVALP